MQIDRISAFVMTLHPDVAGRTFAWRPGDAAKVGAVVDRERRAVRRRISDGARDSPAR